ncbi:MAG: polynucleotide kinase-phosphatase [Oscillospiraceae bacterium]|jgi:protein phosphatase|nr:polynucleotide kinase-phosphatase [Oscillospiraceae bacterium]
MRLEIPELAVIALVGVSGSGKSTFAKTHFKETEVLSSDFFRALISDDENNQSVTSAAFETLYYVANKRLSLGLLTVIDATNVQKEAREGVLKLAKAQNCHAVAIVLDMPESLCRTRNETRSDRNFGDHVIRRQSAALRRSIKHLQKEGFRHVYVLQSPTEAAAAEIVRTPLWNNKKDERGPFDIIGDVHGCYDELCALLTKMGYAVDKAACTAAPPPGRKAVFLGDLCDRGPHNMQVLRLVMDMAQSGHAYCVAGNHDVKLLKKLSGKQVQLSHGLETTTQELAAESDEFLEMVQAFLRGLISHYVFDNGNLVVAHAGLKEAYQGRGSARVRDFCLFGDTNGETDAYGLPVRLPWASEYRGKALVVYGHTPTPEAAFSNNTICIDTGCVFGGKLTALRYPEKALVEVLAAREYYAPAKPLLADTANTDDMLSIEDVMGQKYLSTPLRRAIKIREENAAAALEAISRFAADPHWLVYLPPTMSPCETSTLPDYLEYPTGAFAYYKASGVGKVVCEQKHMGSRAVIVLCKDEAVAAKRFAVSDGSFGIIYTRMGRHFFEEKETETQLLSRLRAALTRAHFWEDFATDWVCIDAELMPWSAKAQKLLVEQYAPVGRAGRDGLTAAAAAIQNAASALGAPNELLSSLLAETESRKDALARYADAYRAYCWTVNSVEDYRIAPFHLLATEGKTWADQTHLWHMDTIKNYMTGSDPIFVATKHILVDLADENSVQAGIDWWLKLTESGGEGMVVKPYDFIATKNGELLQPAVKCRGREYLRIIYGPEYTLGDNLQRLKKRSLTRKRNLALNEFALGMESLQRFVKGDPLYRVHECVFGVLAMESEPVDPRL